jgi:acyl dehydratase
MSSLRYEDVEFGDELPFHHPDVRLENVQRFTDATGMSFGRFNDHEEARKAGLPGAIVPGIMSQGIFSAMLHAWAPGSLVLKLDTIFRAPVVADTGVHCTGVVTDRDDEARSVELDLTLQGEDGETKVLGTATVQLA